jgi:hypothetical protein
MGAVLDRDQARGRRQHASRLNLTLSTRSIGQLWVERRPSSGSARGRLAIERRLVTPLRSALFDPRAERVTWGPRLPEAIRQLSLDGLNLIVNVSLKRDRFIANDPFHDAIKGQPDPRQCG